MPITFCSLTKLAKRNQFGNTFAVEGGGKCMHSQTLSGEGQGSAALLKGDLAKLRSRQM